MIVFRASFALLFAAVCSASVAQSTAPAQPQLRVDTTNRSLTVSAEERVTVDPEVAILHIGFETLPMDAKAAYAEGARKSNAIIAAVKQAGIADASIHSEWQSLERSWNNSHKFVLAQQWTVRTPPERSAEILDIAISAGATESGAIGWTVEDVKALEQQALSRAAERAKMNADVLAKGMGAHLGSLIYVTNQIAAVPLMVGGVGTNFEARRADKQELLAPPLAIAPRKVTREATVYAVYSLE